MSSPRIHHAATRVVLRLLPWLILAVTLGITCFAWNHERQTTRTALHSQFDFALRETVSRIEQRVMGYAQMLRGVQSLFATTDLANRAALHDYVQALQLDANFSGAESIGVVAWVPAPREFHAPIIGREPTEGHYLAPLGHDVWTEPVLRLALEKARDSGMVTISGKIPRNGDIGVGTESGFAMCLPIFAQGQPHDSVAQRRNGLIGWVYATFRMNDFMASLYGTQSPGLTLAMHDGTEATDAALLYHSKGSTAAGDSWRQAAISATEYMVVAGHNWTLSLNTQEAFEANYGRGMATLTAIAGAVLSLLLAMLSWQMINGREQALRLAAAMTEELRHMAQHDPLTGLPNRALFSDRLNHELARAKRQHGRFAMVFLDLDYFKPVNDNLGHDVGDLVLQQVARQLKATVREADTVGRIGGDEFVVLMAQLSASEAILTLAEKLHQAVRQPFVAAGHELSVSCSIGVAVYPENGTSAAALTKSADAAMYRAKQAGRDCVRLCTPPD